ncbi:MAG: hypothetical protein FWD16_04160 [Clostridia bacterium]|nr:hypothetical protein [Clostridia bacterium]
MQKYSNYEKLGKEMTLYSVAKEGIALNGLIQQRAALFQAMGIKPMDSFHLALAEANDVDVFLTTDDRLLKKANLLGLQIKTANPVAWLMEVMKDEH